MAAGRSSAVLLPPGRWLDRVGGPTRLAVDLAVRGEPFLWPLLEGVCAAAGPELVLRPELVHRGPVSGRAAGALRLRGAHVLVRVWSEDPDATVEVSGAPRRPWCHVALLRPGRPLSWPERRRLDDVRRAVLAAVGLRARLAELAR